MSGLDLVGRVSINTTPAQAAVRTLAKDFNKLSAEGKLLGADAQRAAQGFRTMGQAANAERASIAKLAQTQAIYNREIAKTAAIQAKTRADTFATRALGKQRLASAASTASVGEGQAALLNARRLTEEYRRQGLAADVAGRQEVRAAQIASAANRDRIAQQRLLISQQRLAGNAARAQVHSLGETRSAFASAGSSATLYGGLVTAAYALAIVSAIKMERQFANVVRTSDAVELKGKAQADAIASLKLKFDALAQSLPVSYKELTQIGTAAGQLGVRSQDLASFTGAVSKFAATANVSVDVASTAFGRLDSLVGNVTRNGKLIEGVNHNYAELSDIILKVGSSSVATETQVINIASQIAGVASSAGFTKNEIVGLSGALASVGTSPYLARGLTTRLFTNLGNAVAEGGDKLKSFSDVAGVSAQEFSTAWNSNRGKALGLLLEGINDSGGNAVNVLRDIGIKSVLDQPAIIKLARGLDSAGNAIDSVTHKGGIYYQQQQDAYSAAGETARQYKVIANTISSKLQVAANRAQIALQKLSGTNVAPLGASIDIISSSILKFTQSLDKPVKLLGAIEIPFLTNGALASGLFALAGAAGIFTLLTGLTLKFVGSLIALRQAAGSVRTFAASGVAALRGYTSATTEATAANAALIASNQRLGSKIRPINSLPVGLTRTNYQTGQTASRQIDSRTSMFAAPTKAAQAYQRVLTGVQSTAGRIGSAYTESIGRMQASNSRFIQTLGTIGTAGTGAFAKIGRGVSSLGAGLAVAGRGLYNLIGGPLGIAVLTAGAFVGIKALSDEARKLGTNAGDVSVQLTRASTAAQKLADIRINTKDGITALFDKSTTNPFTNLKAFQASVKGLGSGGIFNDLASKIGIGKVDFFGNATGLDKGFNTTSGYLDKLNAGVRQLTANDQIPEAVKGLQQLFHGADNSTLNSYIAHSSDVVSDLTGYLNLYGIEAGKGDVNVRKLLKGTLDLGTGTTAAAKAIRVQAAAAAASGETLVNLTGDQEKLIASTTDLNAAYSQASQGAKNGSASFADFIKQANSNYSDLINAQKNALKLAAQGIGDFDSLSKLDPHILAGAVKGSKKDREDLLHALDLPGLASTVEAQLRTIGTTPALATVFNELGPNLQDKLIRSLASGKGIGEAFKSLGPKIAAAYKAAIKGTDLDVTLPAPKIAPSKLPSDIGKSAGLRSEYRIKVDADTKLATDKVTAVNGFVTSSKPYLPVNANPAAANAAINNTLAKANGSKGIITIDGNAALGRGAAESLTAYVDRLKGIITINGNTAPGQRASESLVAYANRLRAAITVQANTAAAQAALNALATNRTVTLNVAVSGGAAAGAAIAAARNANARGGYISGPGTGTSDSIPAMLSNGEYVIRAAMVKKYGNLLSQINNGAYRAAHFAGGGAVTSGQNSTRYEGTYVARQSARNSASRYATQVVEPDARFTRLLEQIADKVGISISSGEVSRASNTGNARQSRRGNG